MNSEIKQINHKRTFFPGEEWLYLKIYTGHKSSEIILERLYEICSEFTINKIIENYFFIRYHDPEFHLRFRCLLMNRKFFQDVIEKINENLEDLKNSGIIWSIEVATYNRELERYGKSTICQVEKLFAIDSNYYIQLIRLISDDENLRWKFALKSIDTFLSDFDCSSDQKSVLMNRFKSEFSEEFGMDKSLKLQLDTNYRKHKIEIEQVLENKYEGSEHFCDLINKRSVENRNVLMEIDCLRKSGKIENELPIGSLIHMMVNRWFIIDQRLHEFVLYYYLSKYYVSKEKRNNQNNL